jgi:O-antigen/teichoic acid export membrane protein
VGKPLLMRLKAKPSLKRLARGAAWTLAGASLTYVLTVLSSILLARVLGKAVYGQLGLVQSTVAMLTAFAGMGFGMTTSKYVAQFRDTRPDRLARLILMTNLASLGMGLMLLTVALIAAPWFAAHFLGSPELTPAFQLASPLVLFQSMVAPRRGTIVGMEAFRATAGLSLMSGVAAFPIVLSCALAFGLNGAAFGYSIHNCVVLIAHDRVANRVCRCSKLHRPTFVEAMREWRSISFFCLPVTLAALVYTPTGWLCNVVLTQKHGYQEFALFAVASQLSLALVFFARNISTVSLPIMSNLIATKNHSQFRNMVGLNTTLSGALTLVLALPLIVAPGQFLNFYGPGFAAGAGALRLLTISSVLMAINFPVGQAIVSMGRAWTRLALQVAWAAVILTGSVLLLPHFSGAFALALATLIAYGVHTILQYSVLWFACPKHPEGSGFCTE